jgi:uncharacterized protein
MVALVKDNMNAIRDVCKKHHVHALYLFGSAVNDQEFSTTSDIDFLYEIDLKDFKDWDKGDYEYIDNLNDLESALVTILKRPVDLVPYKNIRNRYFKKSVDSNSQLIYG